MERKVYGIFVAGGHGTRMGAEIPKQFMMLGGVPILHRTILKFKEACPGMEVITVLPKEHFNYWSELCVRYDMDCPQKLVAGGITRFHSVKNALELVPDGAVVMVHDGVRPLVSSSLITDMLSRMDECGALIPVTPVTDTIKYLDSDTKLGLVHGSEPDPDRSHLFGAQTPQMFHSELLKKAYRQGFDTAFTDDASVVDRDKTPVSYIIGERLNIKITTPEDLVLAEAVLTSSF